MKRDELDIVRSINDSDPEAFKEIFDLYWNKIYKRALQKLPKEEDASDITQEVFYVIWKNRAFWNVTTTIEGYLFSMLRHKIYDFYAKQDRLPLFISLDNQEEYWDYYFEDATKEDDFAVKNAAVKAEIEAMPEKMREIFLLSRFENLSALQIAAKLGISVQTVRNQISSALKRLKIKFGDKTAWIIFIFFIKF
ncbi:RNA polymerase sigma factor [Sphingobacterium psychroaquaticum]|uniref:RNA polymerase sigma factor n=1 Tax=Sphingobacterium psychroaquaticum TaxID=561061 RepID=UPI00141A80BD|nr:sigma-70 family RNA polymerase sigma factor [Sphingobacterium psychroaquaticum]